MWWHGFLPDLGPADCPFGHFFAPGTYQRSWMPCLCPAAKESGLFGHHVWRCRTCETQDKVSAVCYYPPHSRAPVAGSLPARTCLPALLP